MAVDEGRRYHREVLQIVRARIPVAAVVGGAAVCSQIDAQVAGSGAIGEGGVTLYRVTCARFHEDAIAAVVGDHVADAGACAQGNTCQAAYHIVVGVG